MPKTSIRTDVARRRAAILDAAARQMANSGRLEMSRVAGEAQVSRSTLYRHFADAVVLREAVLAHGVAAATGAVRAALSDAAPPLARLRRTLAALSEVGRRYPLALLGRDLADEADKLGRGLLALARHIAELAGLEPGPPARLARVAAADLVESALIGAAGEEGGADALFERVTEPLDQGLLLLDGAGRVVALNPIAGDALALEPPPEGKPRMLQAIESVYEDGSQCPSERHPIAAALASRASQPATVRGQVAATGELRWFVIRALALTRPSDASPHGYVAVLSDVSAERRAELAELHAPGSLGRMQAVPIDVVRVLDEIPASLLPEQLVAEAQRLVGAPVALYVVDIDGSNLLRLAGTEEFPERIKAPLALGPELAESGLPDLQAFIDNELPGAVMAPMWLRGRAVGVLLASRATAPILEDVARLAAPAVELANGYTDVFDSRRRRREINPAAEIQQSLLPPRIARLSGGEVACGVLPSYEVGGDWFDYVENRGGAWLAIADAAGRGPRAGALGGLGLAALRAARRNEANLDEAAQTIHATIVDAGEEEFFLTAIVAHWSPAHSALSWINAGHPPPLLLRGDNVAEELATPSLLPLGLGERERSFQPSYRQLDGDSRLIFYTDGVSARPKRRGFFGKDGIAAAAGDARNRSAAEIARSIQTSVVAASTTPLRDDAAVLVLAPRP